jgi:hypothetical protein
MRAFTISFGIGLLLHGPLQYASSGQIRPNSTNSTSSPSPVAEKNKWRVAGMGELQASDGTPLSFTTYKSADGVPVTVIYGTFSSEMRAAQELDSAVKNAEKIVNEGPSRDSLGNAVGKRAVLLVRNEPSNASETAILWTNGQSFYEVLSPSQPVAIYWEKRNRAK